MSRMANTVRLNDLVEFLNRIKGLKANDKDSILPYFNLVSAMNHLTQSRLRSKQLVVLDTTNSCGLFAEDYIDILMLTQPHSLVTQLASSSLTNKKLVLNSQIVTRTLLNTILYRENYLWKRPLVKSTKTTATTTATTSTTATRSSSDLPAEPAVLDLFDTKYSNPVLSIQDSHDIFYAGHVTNQTGVDDLVKLVSRFKSKKR